jgi:lysophospholipase L1-like esterase
MDTRAPLAGAGKRRCLAALIGAGLVLALVCSGSLSASAAGVLWHLASRFADSAPVKIVAFGSSSTSGIGASSPEAAYPACLERDLRAALKAAEPVQVLNRGVAGDDIDAMMRRLEPDVLAEHPDLVIWQLGTNDALRGVPIAHFEARARAGIRALRKAGIDLVLMEPQRAPRVDAAHDSALFRIAVRRLAAEFGLPVIRRFDLMAHWAQASDGPVLVAPDGLHMSDTGYARLGQATAELILAAARLTIAAR